MSIDWLDLIYLLGIPVIQQGLKLLTEEFGWVLVKWQNQVLTLVLALGVGLLGGDFLGLQWVAWGDDLMAFISGNLETLAAAWLVVSGLYEALWDKIFGLVSRNSRLRAVTKDKLPG